MPTANELCRDLNEEQEELDEVLSRLTSRDWATGTPAAGWNVLDCLSHLCYFDETAALAASDPVAFEKHRKTLHEQFVTGGAPDLQIGREMDDHQLLLER